MGSALVSISGYHRPNTSGVLWMPKLSCLTLSATADVWFSIFCESALQPRETADAHAHREHLALDRLLASGAFNTDCTDERGWPRRSHAAGRDRSARWRLARSGLRRARGNPLVLRSGQSLPVRRRTAQSSTMSQRKAVFLKPPTSRAASDKSSWRTYDLTLGSGRLGVCGETKGTRPPHLEHG